MVLQSETDELLATNSIKDSLSIIQGAQLEQQKAPPADQPKLAAAIAAKTKAVDEAVAKFPDSSLVQEAGAQAALQVGDTGAATRRAGRAVTLAEGARGALGETRLIQALKTRALARAAAHDYPAAAQDARRALTLRPGDQAAQAILKLTEGRARGAASSTGSPRPPAPDFQALLDQARGDAALSRPAGFMNSVDRTKQAETDLRLADYEEMGRKATLALRQLPDNPKAHMQRAFASLMLKRYEEAIADADAGLALRPDSYSLLALRAAAKLETGRPREALQDAERAVTLNPRDAFSWVQKGLAAERLGQPEPKYLGDLKNAAELNPEFERFYTEALARRGLKSEAAPANPVAPWWARPAALASGVGALLLLLGAGAFILLRPARAPPAGVVGGCFKLGKLIGAGGMGAVYEAWDTNLERPVAVKRMSAALRDDKDEAARFIQEAKTVASLKHPNIVAIHDAFQDGGELYLVFELVRGPTLNDHMKQRGGRLPRSEALALLEPLCAALDYAHARGVIHRDLKPANVMLEDGRLKVMDFGIARRTSSRDGLTMTDQVIGTPAFMAPEQQRGEVSRESDLYAVGVCAYLLLAGRLPFDGDIGYARKMEGRFDPISAHLPSASALDPIFARALHPDRQQRFHGAGELFAALRDAVRA